MVRKGFGALTALWLLAGACKGPEPVNPGPVTPSGNGEVLVVCEGSLGNGNSALSKLPADTSAQATEDVFYAVNGQQLGDVFQSITATGNALALCINNSDKIVFIHPGDYRLQQTVAVEKPRYLLPLANGKALVSSLFRNRLFVLDLARYAVTDTVFFPYKNPEGLLLHEGAAYAAVWDTANRFLYRLSSADGRITDSFDLGRRAPQAVLADKNRNLWVLSGNDPEGVRPALTCLNPQTGQVLRQLDFPAGQDVIKPCFNAGKDTLYWLRVDYNGGAGQSGVFRMPIGATTLPQTAFVASGNLQYFWALGIQPGTGNVYLGDPKGFIQRGEVLVYSPSGTLLKRWSTGVGPGAFCFL